MSRTTGSSGSATAKVAAHAARPTAMSAKNPAPASRCNRDSRVARARTSGSGPAAPAQLDCHRFHSASLMALLLVQGTAKGLARAPEPDGDVFDGDAHDAGDLRVGQALEGQRQDLA